MALQMTWQQQQQQRRRKGAPPVGLKNLGNTCYLNSVLQCLAHTPPLAQFCLSSTHSSLCKSVPAASRDKDCPFCILERQIARSLTITGPVDAPSKIQKSLPLFAEHFRWGRQEDAHEFLRYVIEACHDASVNLLKHVNTNGGAKGKDSGSPKATIMKEIFGGALLSQVKCMSCKGESNTTDDIMDVSLDLCQSNSVKDALTRFFRPEVLDGNNKYNCEKCKKLSVAKKQMFVMRAPNVLVIQLKRFEGVHGKINRTIEFEELLVLSKFMYITCQDSQPEYNLFGSIVHSGYSQESGHYYAYIKDALGRWYRCNDAHVSLSSTQEVLSEKVYILFYLRTNQSPRPCKTDLLDGEVRPSDSNGNGTSPCQRSTELLKPSPAELNGSLPLKSNGTTSFKNGKICRSPQIKTINLKNTLKNTEFKGVSANGKSNRGIHNDTSVKSSRDFQQPKKSEVLSEYNSNGKHNKVHSVPLSSVPNSNGYEGNTSSDKLEHHKKQTFLVSNEVGCSNLREVAVDDNGSQDVAFMEGEPERDLSSNHIIDNSGISLSKRKLGSSERDKAPVLCATESTSLSKVDASRPEISNYRKQPPELSDASSMQKIFYRKHSPEEFEKFKEALTKEAYSNLQSCDWYAKVHEFMHTRKKLRVQESGSYYNKNELRNQLKNDARKNFASQIPESLKSDLIDRLQSFIKGNRR